MIRAIADCAIGFFVLRSLCAQPRITTTRAIFIIMRSMYGTGSPNATPVFSLYVSKEYIAAIYFVSWSRSIRAAANISDFFMRSL